MVIIFFVIFILGMVTGGCTVGGVMKICDMNNMGWPKAVVVCTSIICFTAFAIIGVILIAKLGGM